MKRYIIFFLLVASSALAFTPWWVLGIPGWLLLANLIHELAHLVAYWLTKLPLTRLQWGPVVYTQGKLFLDPNGKAGTAICSCKAVSRPFYCYAIALLSGGATALILGIVCLLLQLWAPGIGLLLNGCFTLFNPKSTDRRILKSLR